MKTLTQIILAIAFSVAATAQNVPMARADGTNVSGAAWKTNLSFLQAADVSAAYQPLISVTQNKLLGRGASSGTGAPEAITLGTNLSLSGTTLNATGGQLEINSSVTWGPRQDSTVYPAPSTSSMGRWSYKSPGAYGVNTLKLVFANWYNQNTGVAYPTAVTSFRCSVEYPAGTFTPVFFNGKRDYRLEQLASVTSDPIDVFIPADTEYWVRIFNVCKTLNLASLHQTHWANGSHYMTIGQPGVAASLTCTQSGGVINTVTLVHGGSGYAANTEITCTVTGGPGTGAVVKVLVGDSGVLTDTVIIENGGSGYTGTPTITAPGNATGVVGFSAIPYDMTTQGTMAVTYTGVFGGFGPSQILATPSDRTLRRSYFIIGDSISDGYTDSTGGGWNKRIFTTYKVPVVISAHGGGTLQTTYLSQNVAREFSFARGCTDAIIMIGTNDVHNGRSLAQIQADYAVVVGKLQAKGLRVSCATITPNTSAAMDAAEQIVRVNYNDWLRTIPLGMYRCYETADTCETSRNSGAWKSGYDADLIHPSATGHAAIAAAFSTIEP